MSNFKLEVIFKAFIFTSILLAIIASTTEKFWEKFCFFFSVSTTLFFIVDLEFIYERCENTQFKVKRKLKEFFLWIIFFNVTFMLFLMTFNLVKNVMGASNENLCGVLAILIWVLIHRLIKSSAAYFQYACHFSSSRAKPKAQSLLYNKYYNDYLTSNY